MEYNETLAHGIREMQEQLEAVEKHISDFEDALINIEEFQKISEGTQILIPIAKGVFAKASKTNGTFTVNVGSGVAVEKNLEDTKEMIYTQIEELKKLRQEMAENIELIIRELKGDV